MTTPRFVFTPRRFNLALITLGLLGLAVRLGGRPTGTLFRDDAWVALSSRVPLHTALHMLGTAPLYNLFVRWWVGVVGLSHSALLTVPMVIEATLAPILVTLVAAWWGLRRDYALLAGFFIVISRSDIMYATHLKPYAHDLIAGILVLAAGEFARRGRSAGSHFRHVVHHRAGHCRLSRGPRSCSSTRLATAVTAPRSHRRPLREHLLGRAWRCDGSPPPLVGGLLRGLVRPGCTLSLAEPHWSRGALGLH